MDACQWPLFTSPHSLGLPQYKPKVYIFKISRHLTITPPSPSQHVMPTHLEEKLHALAPKPLYPRQDPTCHEELVDVRLQLLLAQHDADSEQEGKE